MSKVRTNSPIEEVDRLAREEGLTLGKDGKARTFKAFGRSYRIEEAPAGKNGLFKLHAEADDPKEFGYDGTETRDRLRTLFRRAVKWKEEVP